MGMELWHKTVKPVIIDEFVHHCRLFDTIMWSVSNKELKLKNRASKLVVKLQNFQKFAGRYFVEFDDYKTILIKSLKDERLRQSITTNPEEYIKASYHVFNMNLNTNNKRENIPSLSTQALQDNISNKPC